ncbi:STT3 domain-containing protein [Haloarchaeobius litoreus]|uniref:dolichyl-phosphooligosaccharide-protein glycotransferase n=1 Tax=Haloarchaeobius litoreus TaxID=755306 RepID=A0ABD6DIC6_9EURY|nr:STT3 domain-containing protein [Haloarchaeobius litoreus]
MDDVRSATESLIADKPALEDDLEAVLDVDADADGWTFDDIPVDSGVFGELVSRGIVGKADDGDYRVADRTAVRAALDGDDTMVADDGSAVSIPSLSLPSVDRRAALALVGALLLVVAMRAFPSPSVFRGDAVVLSSNDPYLYRYWVDQLLAKSSGPLDFAVLGEMAQMANGEPLLVAVLWFISALLGGGQHTAGVVLAVYPVVAAVVAAVLLYLLAVRLTGDRRAGLAAVVMLAVTPDHALRTAIGFADHHAFDYPWLLLTAYGLVGALDRPDLRDGEGWLATVCLGVGIAGQVLAWEAGPLLILPVSIAVAASALALVAVDESVLAAHRSLLVGTAIGAGLVGLVHVTLGWHATVVVATPALLFAGVAGVTLLGEAFVRSAVAGERTTEAFVGVQTAVGAGVLVVAFVVLPEFGDTLTRRLDFLLNTPGVAETGSLFKSDLGLFLAPLFSFGLVLFFALPYLGWVTWRAARVPSRRWFVPVSYAWWFLLLSAIQVRFSGELAAFAALFAGVGFVHVVALVDLTERVPAILASERQLADGVPSLRPLPRPDRTTVQYVAVILVVVAGVGMLFSPLKIGLTTIDGGEYETATAIDAHAAEHDIDYPENYVFSEWDRNRMYNYFVSGESRSYGYAQSNYEEFLSADNGSRWYERLTADERAGYIITTDEFSGRGLRADSLHIRLHEHVGSTNGSVDGLGHYQLVQVRDGGSVKIFSTVTGARLVGNVPAGDTVETTFTVDGETYTYERTVERNGAGVYELTVPYAGDYTLGDETIAVSESAVAEGGTTSRFEGPGAAHWSFDSNEGRSVYDLSSGQHASIDGATWADGSSGSALSFDGEDDVATVPNPDEIAIGPNESLTVSVVLRGDLTASGERLPRVLEYGSGDTGRFGIWARTSLNDFGVRFDDVEGDQVKNFGINGTSFDDWTRITVVLDREVDEVRLYRNDTLVSTRDASQLDAIRTDGELRFGGRPGSQYASMTLDDVRVYHDVVLPEDIPAGGSNRSVAVA